MDSKINYKLLFKIGENMLKILQADEEYKNNIKQYTKKDGILSCILFGIMILDYSIFAVLQIKFEFIKENIRLVGCLSQALLIIVTILFLKLNKQSLETIGLYKGKWKISIIIGIVYASIIFCDNYLPSLINGKNLVPVQELLINLFYFLLLAICEEIVFRGYIGTRMNGLIKNKWLVVLVVGILFIMIHFPYRMIANGTPLSDLIIKQFSWIINLLFWHIISTFIYLKTNSLYGAIIPHWISNFALTIF